MRDYFMMKKWSDTKESEWDSNKRLELNERSVRVWFIGMREFDYD